MSVIFNLVIETCNQRTSKNRALGNRVSSVILNVKQNAEIENVDDSKQSPEKHAKIEEIKRFSNKKSIVAMTCIVQ